METKKIRWESYEAMLERKAKNEKRRYERQIQKKLNDPTISREGKDALIEELYRDIDIK